MHRTEPSAQWDDMRSTVGNAKTLTIVVAEDDIAILGAISSFLRQQRGLTVVEAHDGDEALRAVTAYRPPLAILDINMPGIDGVELCRRIKGDPALANVAVLVISGHTNEARLLAALEAGADDFIAKPFSPALLLSAVDERLLATRTAQ